MIRTATATVLLLALGACGKAATESDNPQPGATPMTTGEAVAAASSASAAETPAAFAQCKTCHSVEPGRHQIGPSLAGVYGKPAAAAPGYTYSAAMKGAGLTWDDATLDRFLEAPMRAVPGTKMVYPGLKDPAKRAEVIHYLETL
jgi:cytochrome c